MLQEKNHWVTAYVGMPLFISVIAGIILYIGLKPVFLNQILQFNRLFNAGNTYSQWETANVLAGRVNNEILKPPQQTAEEEKQEITEPNIGEQYGRLVCERIGIDAPIYFGDNPEVLNYGVGTYPASWIPGCGGTTLMSGHNNTDFTELANVETGDIFILTTDYGEYQYRVSEFTIVKETEVEACRLQSDTEQVVLYTCYPFYRISGRRDERFFVYLEKLSGPEIELTDYFLKE